MNEIKSFENIENQQVIKNKFLFLNNPFILGFVLLVCAYFIKFSGLFIHFPLLFHLGGLFSAILCGVLYKRYNNRVIDKQPRLSATIFYFVISLFVFSFSFYLTGKIFDIKPFIQKLIYVFSESYLIYKALDCNNIFFKTK